VRDVTTDPVEPVAPDAANLPQRSFEEQFTTLLR
jgi:hypothetical protein